MMRYLAALVRKQKQAGYDLIQPDLRIAVPFSEDIVSEAHRTASQLVARAWFSMTAATRTPPPPQSSLKTLYEKYGSSIHSVYEVTLPLHAPLVLGVLAIMREVGAKTPAALASSLHVKPATVSAWLRGSEVPSWDDIALMAQAAGVGIVVVALKKG